MDLDAEVVKSRGERIAGKDAEQIAERVLKSGRGRPSLTGEPAKPPHLNLRVAPELKTRLQDRANREGKKVSDVVREVLESNV